MFRFVKAYGVGAEGTARLYLEPITVCIEDMVGADAGTDSHCQLVTTHSP